jgi:hypothetical protein
MQGGGSETYSELQVNPEDVIDWQALNYPAPQFSTYP